MVESKRLRVYSFIQYMLTLFCYIGLILGTETTAMNNVFMQMRSIK